MTGVIVFGVSALAVYTLVSRQRVRRRERAYRYMSRPYVPRAAKGERRADVAAHSSDRTYPDESGR
jgi:hypothetical protein